MLNGRSIALIITLLFSGAVSADQYHYNNVISGDRSMGLGGAYAGMSSDASGIFYNPAGMGFALSNDFQGSANALFSKEITYKETIGKDDFIEHSEGQLAPFFGGLQKLDHISPGLVFAFGINTTDSELKDQNDTIKNTSLGISSYNRTANQRASTTYIGVALAKRVSSSLSVGFGMNYAKVDELTQEYQDAQTLLGTSSVTEGKGYFSVLTQNLRQRLLINALQPVLAVQYVPVPKLSFGLTLKYAMVIDESYELYRQQTVAVVDNKYNYVDKATDDAETKLDLGQGVLQGRESKLELEVEDATKQWPMEVRAGLAYFSSPRFLVALDVTHHGKTDGEVDVYDREAVTNFALGTEYYVSNAVPVRVGIFSNYDARPEVEDGKTDQRDHIDYHGLSAFVGWVQPNSQIAAGIIEQRGSGKAQKISSSKAIQDVVATSRIFALSITSTF